LRVGGGAVVSVVCWHRVPPSHVAHVVIVEEDPFISWPFPDPGRSSSPYGLWTGVRKVGVIRHRDFSFLADIEGQGCGFVGACHAFPAAAGRERHV